MFFVEFVDESVKWVVRIPLEPTVCNVWEKVQNEVATIQYLEINTTIPVAHVHGFGNGGTVDKVNPLGLAYIILDYIPGRPLDLWDFLKLSRARKSHFYSQLIDIFAQLREQEFNCAGSLMPDPDGGPTPVLGPSLSMQLNELQIDLAPSHKAISTTKFASAIDFAFHQYQILDQSYRLPTSEPDRETTQLELFGLEDLKGRIFSHIDPRWNHGPFALAHADLRHSNIIVDKDFNIQGVIDWEWTSTIPLQFFIPPTWLAGHSPDLVASVYYQVAYMWFYDALKATAATSKRCLRLLQEWGKNPEEGMDFSMAVTLRHHGHFISTYYQAIFPRFYKTPRTKTVNEFFARDGESGPFSLEVQRRLDISERYTRYLKDNGLFCPREVSKESQEVARRDRGARCTEENGSFVGCRHWNSVGQYFTYTKALLSCFPPSS